MKKESFHSLVILLAFLMSFGGCQNKKTDPSHIENQSPEVPSEPLFPAGEGPLSLKAEARGLEKPHQYQIKLSWLVENQEPSVFFLVQRHDWNDSRVVQGDQTFYLDEKVEEGKEYFYQVRMLNGSQATTSDHVKILVPKDKVFEKGEHTLKNSLEGFHRIFFLEEAKIFWQGEKIEIKSHKIISENAVFESFSEEFKKAPLGMIGKSGGQFTLIAKELKGSLFIRADGQSGGQGETGIPGKNGTTGEQGPTAYLHWGNVDTVPPGAHHHNGYWFLCDPPRLPGGKGKPGEQGGIGNRGMKGGNSGKIFVDIEKADQGDVFFTNKPGSGGEGGLGGPGGEGGPGGNPGPIDWQSHASKMPPGANLDFFHQCAPIQGEKGNSGIQGPQGPAGEEGFQAPFCLRLGNSKMGQCP